MLFFMNKLWAMSHELVAHIKNIKDTRKKLNWEEAKRTTSMVIRLEHCGGGKGEQRESV